MGDHKCNIFLKEPICHEAGGNVKGYEILAGTVVVEGKRPGSPGFLSF